MSDWWASKLEKDLSQGDVFLATSFATAKHPFTPLQRASDGHGPVWKEGSDWLPDEHGRAHALGWGRKGAAIVISHSCDLDKKNDKGRVLVAPVPPLSGMNESAAAAIIAQHTRHAMTLPAIPTLGDCYADLRNITFIDRRILHTCTRHVSMTVVARQRLMAQLVVFFTRADLNLDMFDGS